MKLLPETLQAVKERPHPRIRPRQILAGLRDGCGHLLGCLCLPCRWWRATHHPTDHNGELLRAPRKVEAFPLLRPAGSEGRR